MNIEERKNYDKYVQILFQISGYNFSLISEKNNEVDYDLDFDISRLDQLCK